MKTQIFYSSHYDFNLWGIERLHPFDAKKFSRTWSILTKRWGDKIDDFTTIISHPVTQEQLSIVHPKIYLDSLRASKAIADVVEATSLKFLPNFILQRGLITPAKYACAGTLEAARHALTGCISFNLGGGFHHAFRDHGEGFCFFADAALALETMKTENRINNSDKIVMIDLDAHRGNGFTSFYETDVNVGIFDLYNMQVYPGLRQGDQDMHPYIIPMRAELGSEEYLHLVKSELPTFLDDYKNPKLAFYNAGTDVLHSDRLGALNVNYDAVKERDRFVVDLLREKNIPTVIMTSGGYSNESHRLIADLASYLISTST